MQYHRAFGPRLTLFVTCLLLVAGFASPAVAQDGSTDISFTVSAYTCEQDPGTVSVAAGNIPGDCVPTAGVSFTVATDDGSFSDVCTTDDSGNCSVMVPNEAMVTVTEDTSTAPANTAPRENPITTEAVTEFAGALFINLRPALRPLRSRSSSASRSTHAIPIRGTSVWPPGTFPTIAFRPQVWRSR